MPKSISIKHLNRMFPFEFFDELSGVLKEYVLLNPAFILRDQAHMSPDMRKELFRKTRENQPIEILSKNNLIQVEPFGELLTLEVCCPAEDAKTVLGDRERRGQSPLSIIVAQLYDSSGLPVFATDVTEDTIEKIPEVLWDDPNLLLGIVTFTQEQSSVGIIKIPEAIEKRVFESVEPDNDEPS